jgi:FAD/FMN-containing dehydrogenase
MKRKITTRTKSIPNPERRRFLEKAGGVMAGSLILPSLSFAVGNPGQESMQTLANLKNAVSGSVIEHGTPNYEPWRRSMIWQYRNFRRYPDIMVQAENEDDVVAAVKFARENKLKITTRSGGHSWSGCFLRNGGVLLDLSRLQSVKIDVEGKQAIVEPGVIGRVLNARLGEVGLAFPTAHCGMVGVSGFLLGGGLGLNGTAWGGISTSNIQAIDLVTAEGEKLHASAEENQDYFWAARGAGPGLFFTVTRFYLKCYALPKAITTAMYTLPYSELVALAEALDELGPNIDPRIEMLGVVIPTPQELKTGGKYGNHRHVCLLSATAFVDSTSEAAAGIEHASKTLYISIPLSVCLEKYQQKYQQ